jgi:hypothetical protein
MSEVPLYLPPVPVNLWEGARHYGVAVSYERGAPEMTLRYSRMILSSKSNLPQAIDFRASRGANVVT